jgi:hypothetical protein
MKKPVRTEVQHAANAMAQEIMERLAGEDIAVAGIALTLVLGWVIGHGGRANGGEAEMRRLHDGSVAILGQMLEEDIAKL